VPRFTRTALLIAAALAAVGIVAAAFGRSVGVPVPTGYKGVEATLPVAYKAPVKKGSACTIGFQNPIAGNETLHTLQLAVVAQAKTFGCKVISLDDQTTPDKQVSNMQQLIAHSHETPKAKKAHVKRAWQLFRSLVERKIVEFIDPRSSRREPALISASEHDVPNAELDQSRLTPAATNGQKLRVNVELQDDFSMDQALSLYLLETIPLVDPQSPDYALVLLTLVESILEDPDIILRKQLDKVKDRKMAEMKMEGIEYEQRMEELEKLEHPKPNREFVYSTFNAFAA